MGSDGIAEEGDEKDHMVLNEREVVSDVVEF